MKWYIAPFLFSLALLSCKNDETPLPTITGYNRKLSTPGKELVISGNNFSTVPEENIVMFTNEIKAEVRGATPTEIKAIVPLATTGPIKVTVRGKTAVGPEFIVYFPGTVTSISPVCGPIGTTVRINGSGFELNPTDNFVLFKGEGNLLAAATVSQATTSQLTVTVPSDARSGPIYLAAFGSEALNINPPNATTFTIASFILSDFTPKSAQAGTNVSIAGSGFSTTIANNVVTFAAVGGTRVVGNIVSATDSQLIVTIPQAALTGPISVKVGSANAVSFNSSLAVTF